MSPPGFAALYAKAQATLRTSDCTYNTWSHTDGSTYVTPTPPYTSDMTSYNAGDNTRAEGWTQVELWKNGSPYLYAALATIPAQPTSEPPCLL